MQAPTEGVIKFQADHREGPLSDLAEEALHAMLGWRGILFGLGLLGRDPARYEGLSFGNISVRLPPWTATEGRRPFVISGAQTSFQAAVTPDDFSVVNTFDLLKNRVQSRGPALPSSESMTHGAIYDLSNQIRAVVHVHSPLLFKWAPSLRLPTTPSDVSYGTPEMAHAVRRLRHQTNLMERKLFVMGGHLDGVVAFGASAEAAAGVIIASQAEALAKEASDKGAS
jgi:ribulose-5-phosphate 4-epimerase/fuculose-1-phosphate aldolase